MGTYGPKKKKINTPSTWLSCWNFNSLLSPRAGFIHFRKSEDEPRAKNRDDDSHFLTELTISLPQSEIGGSGKHTIRNHYSAPNCCWQAWARQMRKWKDYNTISLSCTHPLIHLPVLNKCIHLKLIWQTMRTSWVTRGTETRRLLRKKKCLYIFRKLC